jgi:ABC-type multidrug transport system fused ATPase/permease subunit
MATFLSFLLIVFSASSMAPVHSFIINYHSSTNNLTSSTLFPHLAANFGPSYYSLENKYFNLAFDGQPINSGEWSGGYLCTRILNNFTNYQGNVIFALRGSPNNNVCSFYDKAMNAQAAGATALVIVDPASSWDPSFAEKGWLLGYDYKNPNIDPARIVIPVIMILADAFNAAVKGWSPEQYNVAGANTVNINQQGRCDLNPSSCPIANKDQALFNESTLKLMLTIAPFLFVLYSVIQWRTAVVTYQLQLAQQEDRQGNRNNELAARRREYEQRREVEEKQNNSEDREDNNSSELVSVTVNEEKYNYSAAAVNEEESAADEDDYDYEEEPMIGEAMDENRTAKELIIDKFTLLFSWLGSARQIFWLNILTYSIHFIMAIVLLIKYYNTACSNLTPLIMALYAARSAAGARIVYWYRSYSLQTTHNIAEQLLTPLFVLYFYVLYVGNVIP